MAEFAEALDAGLRAYYRTPGMRSPITSRRGLLARMDAVQRAAGGTGRAAAALLGVSPDTWSRWRTGRARPSAMSRQQLDRAHKAVQRAEGVKRRGVPRLFSITAVVVCDPGPSGSRYVNGKDPSGSKAHRTFNADQLTTAQKAAVVRDWARGMSPGHVADQLLAGIQSAYGSPFAFEGNRVTVVIS